MATSLDNTNGKIAVLGATGNSGLQLVEQALARNYKVVALVRSPEKLTAANLQHKNLEVSVFSQIVDEIISRISDRSMRYSESIGSCQTY